MVFIVVRKLTQHKIVNNKVQNVYWFLLSSVYFETKLHFMNTFLIDGKFILYATTIY